MKHKLFSRAVAVIGTAVLVSTALPAAADDEAVFKYREGVMASARGHLMSMGAILRGRVHFENFAIHARGMRDIAGVMPNVFPEGSGDVADSEALPAVWDNPEDFKAAMDAFVKAANDIAAAAESGEMSEIGPAMGALGQSCKGCHDDFKAES